MTCLSINTKNPRTTPRSHSHLFLCLQKLSADHCSPSTVLYYGNLLVNKSPSPQLITYWKIAVKAIVPSGKLRAVEWDDGDGQPEKAALEIWS